MMCYQTRSLPGIERAIFIVRQLQEKYLAKNLTDARPVCGRESNAF